MLNKPFRILIVFIGLLAAFLPLSVSAAPALDPENTIYLDLPSGRVVIQMLPNIAPPCVSHQRIDPQRFL